MTPDDEARRRQLAGRGYRFDPDPLHVDDDSEPRVPSFDRETYRRPRPDGVPGPVLVLVIVGIPLVILILAALAWLATRPGDSEVHGAPVPAGGGSSAASLSPGAPQRAAGLDADVVASGAPPPPPAGGVLGIASAPAVVRGQATWYDAPSSTDAAAGPALRKALGRHWRGSTVRVCADACVDVRLTDWCACGPRHGRPTVIDLDDRAFARLAPLSAGVVRVRVTVTGQIDVPLTSVPTAPPTDTE